MEVRILHRFHDKASYNTVYLVGETVTFDDARAEHLIKLGLVEAIVETIAEPVEEAVEEIAESDAIMEESAAIAGEEPVEEAAVKPVAARRRSSK